MARLGVFMTFNSKRCADTSTSARLDSRAWSAPPVRPSSINGKRGNARHRLSSGSGSMSFNPGSALTPSHDDPLEGSVLIRLTETAPARVASTSALEPPLRREVFGSLLEPRRGNIEIHVEDSRRPAGRGGSSQRHRVSSPTRHALVVADPPGWRSPRRARSARRCRVRSSRR